MKIKFTIIILTVLASFGFNKFKTQQNNAIPNIKTTNVSIKLSSALKFLAANKSYNQDIAFLINMKVASGQNRFFVVDVKNKKILDKGLVAHGYGKDGSVKFSNVSGSEMSSLGKYKIGESYIGKFGKSYKLYGLDSSNSNAYARAVVLHEHKDVPYNETTDEIIRSQGCPMVNKIFFNRLEKILDTNKRPILLEIYY
jgi:L,D-transpeptidase catalytic domain